MRDNIAVLQQCFPFKHAVPLCMHHVYFNRIETKESTIVIWICGTHDSFFYLFERITLSQQQQSTHNNKTKSLFWVRWQHDWRDILQLPTHSINYICLNSPESTIDDQSSNQSTHKYLLVWMRCVMCSRDAFAAFWRHTAPSFLGLSSVFQQVPLVPSSKPQPTQVISHNLRII